MNDKKFNGWFVYWSVLVIINFVAFLLSVMNNDFFSCTISGIMLIFCIMALNQNYTKSNEE